VGTTFSFVLDRPATVNLLFFQLVQGRMVDGGCTHQTQANHRKPRCTLSLLVGALQFPGHGAQNKVVFQGRISRRYRIPPGRYVVQISASNPSAPPSNVLTLRFTALR
jgi:hypothetical protein